jgi:electron transport complex protein RnfB
MWDWSLLWAAPVLGLLGAGIGLILLVVLSKLRSSEDERIELLIQMLPGANCGACGNTSCQAMAHSLLEGKNNPGDCPFATEDTMDKIAKLLNAEVVKPKRKIAQALCQGTSALCPDRAEYAGLLDCWSAETVAFGDKGCTFGCLGLGSCVRVCPTNAIHIPQGGVAYVNPELCTGCGMCVKTCPRGVLALIEEGTLALPRCVSTAPGKVARVTCEVGCIQCKACERVCPTGACKVIDGRVLIDPALCTGCGLCAQKCPVGVIDMGISEIFKENEKVSA